MSGRLRWSAWLSLAVVLAVALAIGSSRASSAPTAAQRAGAIDASLRCPSCDGISVADSSASTAVAIRRVVAERVAQGESTARIDSFMESRYGPSILLLPPASGATAVVWIAPLAAIAVALAALGTFFWRRRRPARVEVSQADRDLVERALASSRSNGGDP